MRNEQFEVLILNQKNVRTRISALKAGVGIRENQDGIRRFKESTLTEKHFQDSEWEALIKIFSDESLEMLDEVEPKLVELEKQVDSGEPSADIINLLFRLFHSLKGSAASLQLNPIRDLTHCAENLLVLFRSKQKKIASLHIDLLCQTCDCVRIMIEEAFSFGVKSEMSPEIALLAGRLTAEINLAPDVEPSVSSPAVTAVETVKVPVQPAASKPEPAVCADSLEELKVSITPDMVQKFCEEADELFEDAEQALLVFERNPADEEQIAQAFRALHSFKGNAGFFGYHQFEKLSHAVEEILNGIRQKKIKFERLTINPVLSAIDHLKSGINRLREKGEDHIDNIDELLENLKNVNSNDSWEQQNVPRLGELLVQKGIITQDSLEEALSLQEELAKSSGGQSRGDVQVQAEEQGHIQRQAIRVDTEKLDRLVDLVGELIIAQSNVSNCANMLDARQERFTKELDRLNKITRELQRISMTIRMVPIAGLFRRMIRPVRDLARSLGKNIDLSFIGEDTEVDKNVIELLNDPLMHIVRNAADHGIELADQRDACGKPSVGKIVLEARHSGNEVWVIVKDDGKGLDRDKILAKAISMGFVSSEHDLMADEDLYKLIFEPGFSTASHVTEISGRGVGMDVVKKNIEKLKGIVEVNSQPGIGSRFKIRIPLTLAIIDGMVVQIGNERFIVPTQTIFEFFRPPTGALTSITGRGEAVLLRNKLIPFHRLSKLFGIPGALDDPYQAQIMVVEVRDKHVGLMVDSILGQQQTVIKSLGPNFKIMPGISGAAVMSDGKVGLILDPSGIVNVAEGGR